MDKGLTLYKGNSKYTFILQENCDCVINYGFDRIMVKNDEEYQPKIGKDFFISKKKYRNGWFLFI